MNSRALPWLLAAVLLVAGCSTFETRSKEKSYVFTSLDPATQERLKNRIIHVDDNEDMVYIALGVPDEKKESVTPAGRATTWIYNAYWQEYRGTALVGYRRFVYYDPATKSYRVYYEPVREAIYVPRVEERIRITFQNGKVTVVEQVKN
jgi:hypothetical protein